MTSKFDPVAWVAEAESQGVTVYLSTQADGSQGVHFGYPGGHHGWCSPDLFDPINDPENDIANAMALADYLEASGRVFIAPPAEPEKAEQKH